MARCKDCLTKLEDPYDERCQDCDQEYHADEDSDEEE